MSRVPDGFEPLNTVSPYNTLVGPFYQRVDGDKFVGGLLIEPKHCNTAGRLHGGMVGSIADVTIGHNIGLALVAQAGGNLATDAPGARMATVSLSTDFSGSAREGDWLEVHVDVQKVGGSLAFANAYLSVGEERIARVSAVFKLLWPRK